MTHIQRLDSGLPHVALLEIDRPPFNFLSVDLVRQLADTLDELDRDDAVRCVVLAAAGKAFCAGADFNSTDDGTESNTGLLYEQAMRLFNTAKPIVAAVHGAAIGGGLGLAVAADFRITCAEARFSANFSRLGFHPGFGLSVTLPRLVGNQQAAALFYTGRRIAGDEAVRIGLADQLVAADSVRSTALAFAGDIATSAPLAVEETRKTLRRNLHQEVVAANRHEREVQQVQFRTEDFKEGVRAMTERRKPEFRRK